GVPSDSYESRLFVLGKTRPVVLKGTSTRLSAGDYVLVVEREGERDENATLRQIDEIRVDKTNKTTTIFWAEDDGDSYDNNSKISPLGVAASPFGSTAPDWNPLPPTLTNSEGKHPDAPYTSYWDEPLQGITLKLMSSVPTEEDIPKNGKGLMIVAAVNHVLH